LHRITPSGIMAPGKRAAEQDASRPKRVRVTRHVELVDPVAKQCHTVAEALQSASLPPVIKEAMVAVIPNALAMGQDERHDFQEQMVQTIGNTLHGVEADLHMRLAEAGGGVQEAEKRAEELKHEQALAEDAVLAAFEQSLQKKRALAQTAMKFREAKQALAEARQAQQEGCKEVKKLLGDCEVLTLAMKRFEPLKNGALEPPHSIQEAEHLLNSLKDRLELNDTLSAALPTALVTPILERSSFTTMVVHQFGDSLQANIEDLGERCKAEQSSKQVLADAVLIAEKAFEVAAEHQMEAADVYTSEKDAYGVKTKEVHDKKKAVRETRPLIRKCESSLAELQIKLDKFQKGPLDAFEKLQCRKQEASENTVIAAPESEATAAAEQDAEPDAATLVMTA